MVHRAQRPGISVGGHISSYASSATLYEVGFNHFFRGPDHPGGGDQVFFQGTPPPACMRGRSSRAGSPSISRTDSGRRSRIPAVGFPPTPTPGSCRGSGSSPRSMGIGPLNAIYQARFNRC